MVTSVRTYGDALRFIQEAGMAFVFPDKRVSLPSLWGAVGGDPRSAMGEDDWEWTKQVARAWDLKDELGARRGAYFGRFLRGKGTLIALDLLAPLATLVRSDDNLLPAAREAYERLGRVGELSSLRLRESLRLHGAGGNAQFDKVLLQLYRRLLIATVGTDDSETHWPAAVVDRLEHAFPKVVSQAARFTREKAMARVRARLPDAPPRLLTSLAQR
ncbi:MAG: hypothetical protein HYY16_14655 [Planctomycetes bacterium]|nr:hypothetical protein [Planctomycetota bacterium]